jgi:WD40 repeat protein
VQGTANEVLGVEWAQDGSLLLFSGIFTTLFNASSEKPVYRLEDRLHSSLSPTDDLLATTYLGDVEIYQASNGSIRTTIDLGSSWLSSLAWSPDGRALAAGTNDGRVVIVEPSGTSLVDLSVSACRKPITALSWKGPYLASTSKDQTVTLWSIDLDQGGGMAIRLGTLAGWGAGVTSLSFFPDGDRILSTRNRAGDLLVLSLDGSVMLRVSGQEYTVQGAVSPDGRMIATTTITKEIPPSWAGDLYNLFAGTDTVETLYGGSILIWDAHYGSLAWRIDGHYAHALAWNHRHPSLLAVGDHQGVRVLDTNKALDEPVARFLTDGWVGSMAWSPSGELLAVGMPSRVEVWDPWRPGIVAVEATWRYPYALSWSRDGRWLASLSGYESRYDEGDLPEDWPSNFAKLVIWNLSTSTNGWGLLILSDQALVPRDRDTYLGGCLAWSPNSTLTGVATGTDAYVTYTPGPSRIESLGFPAQNGVMVWALEPGTGLTERPYLGHPGRPLSSVAWSPDCTAIVAGSNDGSISLWRIGPPCTVPVGEAPTLPVTLAISLLLSLLTGHRLHTRH